MFVSAPSFILAEFERFGVFYLYIEFNNMQ